MSRQPASRSPATLSWSLVAIAMLTTTIGSLGAPLITRVATTFEVSLVSAQWSLTALLLTGAVTTPLLGRLGAGPHRRGAIVGSLTVATVGSLLTVLPLSYSWLIVGRAAQGVGLGLTALMMSVARDHLSDKRAAFTIAMLSVTSTIAVGIGYPLAGLLTDLAGLRAAYGFGLAASAIALMIAIIVIPSAPPGRQGGVDVPGTVLLAGGIMLILILVGDTSIWSRHLPVALGLGVLAALVLIAWVVVERRTAAPLVDLQLLSHRVVVGANVAMLVGGVGMYLLLTLI